MPKVHAFHVIPALPEPLQDLRALAFNLRWAWDIETIELFRRLDRDLWEKSGHNPVQMLGTIAQEKLKDAAQDDSFLAQMDRVSRGLYSYMKSENTWYHRTHAGLAQNPSKIAYFSMEFGLTECLPIYSGGLGILAGDHLKSASDLGLPLAGIGLLYQQGYFRQRLSSDGWQQENYPENDFYNLPIQLERDSAGEPIRISVTFPGRELYAQVWRAQVGRVPLYLLDTNIEPNSAADKNITDQLYGGDVEMRLKQELILGIGGLRAITALGINPTICHMNEGHAAFMALERVRMLRQKQNMTFWEAQESTAAGNLFTTHTPVPAGFDVFPADLLKRYFEPYLEGLGLDFGDFLGLGRINGYNSSEPFNMAILAIHHAHQVNGVSELHGKVTRRILQSGYPGYPENEVPVGYVTNGIHTRSFVNKDMADLFEQYLGGRWAGLNESSLWSKVADIPDEEIWRVRERRREKLVQFARARLKHQYEQVGRSDYEVRMTREVLNPHALTIGFARRFATYKRATLLLSDPDRLLRLLNDPTRPVQIILAGKAHPKDDAGKELIQRVVQFARREDVRKSIVFLEDYEMCVARTMVQGVDVWLNTPRRPMEASGTSGMKILANGGLNLSIPDGWWAEAYEPGVGWSIGKGEDYADPNEQDRLESLALYDLLEKEVVPLFYDRSTGDLPRAWISRIKNSIKTLCPVFNTNRMVGEYAEKFYFPAGKRFERMQSDDHKVAKSLVSWKRTIGSHWNEILVIETLTDHSEVTEAPKSSDVQDKIRVGEYLTVKAKIQLGSLLPTDVTVQIIHGLLDSNHQIINYSVDALELKSNNGGICEYEGEIPCTKSGQQGYSVRVVPSHPDAILPQELSLITWEG